MFLHTLLYLYGKINISQMQISSIIKDGYHLIPLKKTMVLYSLGARNCIGHGD